MRSPPAAKALCGAIWREVRSIDAIEVGKGHRRRGHLHADRHPCRPDRAASARAGKAIFCEKPIDLDAERVKQCLEVVEARPAHADGRLQPPLRPAFQAVRARSTPGASARSRW
jgi:myo-inositol 2-dehydrogenase/D-chiro-inositol 1-dehydrogenase